MHCHIAICHFLSDTHTHCSASDDDRRQNLVCCSLAAIKTKNTNTKLKTGHFELRDTLDGNQVLTLLLLLLFAVSTAIPFAAD